MSKPQLKIDTKGVCLLCLTSKNCQVFDENEDNLDSTTPTAVKMLLRYLKVEKLKLSIGTTSITPFSSGLENFKLSLSLCQTCSSVSNEFLELFQQFESIRLQLDVCVTQLLEFMEKGDQDLGRVQEFKRRVNAGNLEEIISSGIAEGLRKEALEKAAQKIRQSLPRVSLNDLASEYEEISEETSAGNISLVQSEGLERQSQLQTSQSVRNLEGRMGGVDQGGEYMDVDIGIDDDTQDEAILDTPEIHCSGEEKAAEAEELTAEPSGLANEENNKNAVRHGDMLHDTFALAGKVTNKKRRLDAVVSKSASNEQLWDCNYCDKQFSIKAKPVQHQLEVHAMAYLSDKGLLPPGLSEEQLNTSVADILGKLDPRQLQCPFCERSKRCKSELRIHLLEQHLEQVVAKAATVSVGDGGYDYVGQRKTPWKCIPCGKYYSLKRRLQEHLLRQHTVEWLVHQKRISSGVSKEQLEKAVASIIAQGHLLNSQFKCLLCGRLINRRTSTRTHILGTHLEKVIEKVESRGSNSHGATSSDPSPKC